MREIEGHSFVKNIGKDLYLKVILIFYSFRA